MRGNAIPEAGDDASTAPPVERDLYPIPEAAVRLGISTRKTWQMVWDGELHTVWLGGRRLVPADAITALVDRLVAESAERVA